MRHGKEGGGMYKSPTKATDRETSSLLQKLCTCERRGFRVLGSSSHALSHTLSQRNILLYDMWWYHSASDTVNRCVV